MKLRTILIDDEESSLSSLKEKLHKHCPQIEITGAFASADEGREAIESLQPDLVFDRYAHQLLWCTFPRKQHACVSDQNRW